MTALDTGSRRSSDESEADFSCIANVKVSYDGCWCKYCFYASQFIFDQVPSSTQSRRPAKEPSTSLASGHCSDTGFKSPPRSSSLSMTALDSGFKSPPRITRRMVQAYNRRQKVVRPRTRPHVIFTKEDSQPRMWWCDDGINGTLVAEFTSTLLVHGAPVVVTRGELHWLRSALVLGKIQRLQGGTNSFGVKTKNVACGNVLHLGLFYFLKKCSRLGLSMLMLS